MPLITTSRALSLRLRDFLKELLCQLASPLVLLYSLTQYSNGLLSHPTKLMTDVKRGAPLPKLAKKLVLVTNVPKNEP